MLYFSKSNSAIVTVTYVCINRTMESVANMPIPSDSGLSIPDYLHERGYRARIEGNVVVVISPYDFEEHYVIATDVDFCNHNSNRNWEAAMASVRRLAMMHTVNIVRIINNGK